MPAVFQAPAPRLIRHLQAGSVKARGLTKRAADKWDSHRQKELILCLSKFRLISVILSRPLTANAGRSAVALFSLLGSWAKQSKLECGVPLSFLPSVFARNKSICWFLVLVLLPGLAVASCPQACHNIGRCIGEGVLPAVFHPTLPGFFRHL